MAISEEKSRFVRKMQDSATLLARCVAEQQALFAVYFARGYNSGGGDPIIDADITETNVTAVEVGAGITMAENLPKFAAGQAVFQSEYNLTLAKLRVDL
jgi:hypothetical protein